MSTQKSYSDAGLWWHWLLATSAGFGIGLLLITSVPQGWLYIQLPIIQFIDLSGVVTMGLVGFFQALVIRPHITRWKLWILATVVGWLAYLLLSTYGGYVVPLITLSRPRYGPFLEGNSITGIQVGLMLGFFQWLMLRGKVEDASWWIVISSIAYAFGLPGTAQIGLGNPLESPSYNSSLGISQALLSGEAGAVGGIVVGAISGLGLIWLLHRRIIIASPPTD